MNSVESNSCVHYCVHECLAAHLQPCGSRVEGCALGGPGVAVRLRLPPRAVPPLQELCCPRLVHMVAAVPFTTGWGHS
jgi:hypothetical protein